MQFFFGGGGMKHHIYNTNIAKYESVVKSEI